MPTLYFDGEDTATVEETAYDRLGSLREPLTDNPETLVSSLDQTDDRPTDIDIIALFKDDMHARQRELDIPKKGYSVEVTTALIKAMLNGDDLAREKLIVSLLPVAFTLMRKYRRMEQTEVLSLANLAIIKAVDKGAKTYDPSKGRNLVNFAFEIADGDIRNAIDRRYTAVTIPDHRLWERRKLARKRTMLAAQGIAPTSEALATATGFSTATIEAATAIQLHDQSLDQPVGDINNKGESEPVTVQEQIAYKRLTGSLEKNRSFMFLEDPTPEDIFGNAEVRSVVRQVLKDVLTEKQYEVLDLYYGLTSEDGSRLNTPEIAAVTGTKQGLVVQTAERARKRLSNVPELKRLYDALVTPSRAYGRKHLTTTPTANEEFRKSYTGRVNAKRKLTDDQVRDIRRQRTAGVKLKDLAEKFNVTVAAIGYITTRKTYKSVL